MARRVVIFNDFSKGDYGDFGASNAPKGSWTGTNMYVNMRGELITRPGLDDDSTGNLQTVGQAGVPLVMVDINQSGTITTIDQDGFVTQSSVNSVATIPNLSGWCNSGNDFYATSQSDTNTYKITSGSPPVVTTVIGSVGGACIAEYGVRLVLGATNATTNKNLLHWSAASDYTSFPAENTVRVGSDSSAITALYVQNDHLLIAKPEGWFIITGSIETGTLRRLNGFSAPDQGERGFVTSRNTLGYMCPDSFCPFMMSSAYGEEMKHITMETGATKVHGWRRGDDDWFVHGNEDVFNSRSHTHWLFCDGRWVHWEYNLDALVAGTTSFITWIVGSNRETGSLQSGDDSYQGRRMYVVVEDGDQTLSARYYAVTYGRNYPPLDGMFYGDPGENSTTTKIAGNVSLPEWYADEGTEIMVRGVTVEFRAWDQTTGVNNHFDVTVDAIRVYDDDAPRTSASLEYDEDETLSSDEREGTLKRRTFSFGDQGHGNGFQIHLADIQGVAIRRIEVVIESQSVRGL